MISLCAHGGEFHPDYACGFELGGVPVLWGVFFVAQLRLREFLSEAWLRLNFRPLFLVFATAEATLESVSAEQNCKRDSGECLDSGVTIFRVRSQDRHRCSPDPGGGFASSILRNLIIISDFTRAWLAQA